MSGDLALAKALEPYLQRSAVKKAISAYLTPGAYAGAQFDCLKPDEEPDRYTEADFLAVSTLSVVVPSTTRRWMLGKGADYVSNLLKHIASHDDAIEDAVDHLRQGSAAWELWYLLRQGTGMGATTTSKLMAVKRPHLIPIHDSVVSEALGLPAKNSWSVWRSYLRGREWKAAKPAVRKAADGAGGGHLSDLRVIDIVVWQTRTEEAQQERRKRQDAERVAKGLVPLVVQAPCPSRLTPKQRWDGDGTTETTN